MAYSITLPNGKVIKNIPDNYSQEDVLKRVYDKIPEWGAAEKRGALQGLGDVALGLGSGFGSLLQLPGQAQQLMTGKSKKELEQQSGVEALPAWLEGKGEDLEKFFRGQRSYKTKGEEVLRGREMAAAEGFAEEFTLALKQFATDPVYAGSLITETLPMLLVGGGTGAAARGGLRAVYANASKSLLDKTALRTAVGTNAVTQGVDIGADTHERVFNQLRGQLGDEEANRIATEQGRKAFAAAAVGSLAFQALPGGTAIEKSLLGIKGPGAAGALKAGALKAGALEFVSEGGEEGVGQLASNAATREVIPETDLWKGVGAATATGALVGGTLGGVSGLYQGGGQRAQQLQQAEAQRQAEVAAARQAYDALRMQQGQPPATPPAPPTAPTAPTAPATTQVAQQATPTAPQFAQTPQPVGGLPAPMPTIPGVVSTQAPQAVPAAPAAQTTQVTPTPPTAPAAPQAAPTPQVAPQAAPQAASVNLADVLQNAQSLSAETIDAIGIPKGDKFIRAKLAKTDFTQQEQVESLAKSLDKYAAGKAGSKLGLDVLDNIQTLRSSPLFASVNQPTVTPVSLAQAPTQPAAPTPLMDIGVSRNTFTEADVNALGIGKTAKIRKQLLAMPAIDPTDIMAVRDLHEALFNYANGTSSEKARNAVASFIDNAPIFAAINQPQAAGAPAAQPTQQPAQPIENITAEQAGITPDMLDEVAGAVEQPAQPAQPGLFPPEAVPQPQGEQATPTAKKSRKTKAKQPTAEQGSLDFGTDQQPTEPAVESPVVGQPDQPSVGMVGVGDGTTAAVPDTAPTPADVGQRGLDATNEGTTDNAPTGPEGQATVEQTTPTQETPQPPTNAEAIQNLEAQPQAAQELAAVVDEAIAAQEPASEAPVGKIAVRITTKNGKQKTALFTNLTARSPEQQAALDKALQPYFEAIADSAPSRKGKALDARILSNIASDIFGRTAGDERAAPMPKDLQAIVDALPDESLQQLAAELRELTNIEEQSSGNRPKVARINTTAARTAPIQRGEPQPGTLAYDLLDVFNELKATGEIPALVRNEKYGNTTRPLIAAAYAGNTRAALEEIVSGDGYSDIARIAAERLLKDPKYPLPTIEIVPAGVFGEGVSGRYDAGTDTVFITADSVDSHSVLHEVSHGFLHRMVVDYLYGDLRNGNIASLETLFNHIKSNHKDLANEYGLTNLSEFVSEAFSNKDFQQKLAAVPYREESALVRFARAVLRILGFTNQQQSALASALILTDRVIDVGRRYQLEQMQAGRRMRPVPDSRTGQTTAPLLRNLNQQQLQQLGARNLYHLANGQAPLTQALPQPIQVPTIQEARASTKNMLDTLETKLFSSDARLSNELRREMAAQGMAWDDMKALILEANVSQAVASDNLATQYLEKGAMVYDDTAKKMVIVEDSNNMRNLVGLIKGMAETHGITVQEANAYANEALIAARVDGLRRAGRPDVDAHRTQDMIDAGMAMFTLYPELKNIQGMWNRIRENVMTTLVDSGWYNQQTAQELLDVVDYVPFTRVLQQEVGRGIGSSVASAGRSARGLIQHARNHRLQGSEQQIDDIFDNMERWVAYAVSHAVRNKKANQMLDVMQRVMPNAVREITRGKTPHVEQHTVDIWVDGELRRYEFDDPLFVAAFQGTTQIAVPVLNWAARATNMLRRNVVLYPMFSLAQLPQDAVSAMFSSGLRNPFGLPLEVVKEFYKTLTNTSMAHDVLTSYGAAGDRDPTANVNTLGQQRGSRVHTPRKFERVVGLLERIAMASDNAVRQAIYNKTLEEGGDRATALERAFEIINFKRTGSSTTLQTLKQYVPFLNAYLQSMNVAYKVVTGRGIAPMQRSEAFRNLAYTSAMVMGMSAMYAAMVADDDEYINMDRAQRDRRLVIPGSSFHIPLRSDLFLFPKMAGEYIYLTMTEQGATDPQKTRKAFRDALVNAVSSPTLVPQFVKPALEVLVDYNFFTGRSIVGAGLKNLEKMEQFTENTSELAKLLGQTNLISPVQADHIIRGMFGTTGAMALTMTNALLRMDSDRPRPAQDTREFFASIPGASAFISKEFGAGAKNDFYELNQQVTTALATYNRLLKRDPNEARQFAQENLPLLQYRSAVNNIENQLTRLRNYRKTLLDLPEARMNADQKAVEIRKINEMERRLLANISKWRTDITNRTP